MDLDDDVSMLDDESPDESPRPGRTHSGRKARKTNPLNVMYSSKFRNPTNDVKLMGELHNLGTAFAIMTVALYGPDQPTEISQHMERERIFLGAAKYAMSEADIEAVLQHDDHQERIIYYHNLLTTSVRPIALIYNHARDFFQNKVFLSGKHNAEYSLHLGFVPGESIFDA